jgi:hypothetical protein
MKKLFTFGDSFTHGTSLCNNHIDVANLNPCKYAWPALLSDMLEMECVNLSKPGAGPKELAHTVSENASQIQSDDIVIVMWPYSTMRTCVVQDNGDIWRIGSWCLDCGEEPYESIAHQYYAYQTGKKEQMLQTKMCMKFADYLLREQTQHVMHVTVNSMPHADNHVDQYLGKITMNSLKSLGIWSPLQLFDSRISPIYTPLDDGHYSREQHTAFAERTYKLLRRN